MSKQRVLWFHKERPGRSLNGFGSFPSNLEVVERELCVPGLLWFPALVFAEGSGAADGDSQGSPPEAAVQAEGWNRREAENHRWNQGVSSLSPSFPQSWCGLGLGFGRFDWCFFASSVLTRSSQACNYFAGWITVPNSLLGSFNKAIKLESL